MKESEEEMITVRKLSSSALAGTIMALLSQNYKIINCHKKRGE
jgi:hypothetical protein